MSSNNKQPPDYLIAPAVNWASIMGDLKRAGCTPYRVAIVLCVEDNTARNWAKGGEPGYGYGRALLRLHSWYCGAGLTTRRVTEGEQVA